MNISCKNNRQFLRMELYELCLRFTRPVSYDDCIYLMKFIILDASLNFKVGSFDPLSLKKKT